MAVAPARRWVVLMVVSMAFFVVELDITVVNMALPSIQRELGFSVGDLQWVINAYLLFFGGFLLLAGRMADLLGRKPMFMAGTVVFGFGSAISAVAPSAVAMVVGRALQGLGGALLTPTGLSTLTTTFTDTRERARALAVWTFIQTGSVALGLAAGGIITELSWRWVFIINIPIAVAVLLAAPAVLPRSERATAERRFDLAGALAVTTGSALLIYALANSSGRGLGLTVALLAAALVVLALLIVIELRSRTPLIRLSIFRVRTLAVGNLSFFLASSALFGMFYFSSLYVQDVLNYRPLPAGMALLPLAAGVLAGVFLAQKTLGRFGLRAVGTAGLAVAMVGALFLAAISAGGGYLWPFLPGLVLLSFGLGLSMVSLTLLATSGVPESDAGLASGVFTAVSYIGGAVGLAVLSSIAAVRTGTAATALIDGFRAAYLTAAVLLGAAALVLVTLVRQRHLSSFPTSESSAASLSE